MGTAATRTQRLMDTINARIASRALAPGDRLPSVRRFAETMGVSPSTVVEAYDRLAAEGVIRARRGSGFYVTGANLPPMALAQMAPADARDIDPFWVSRQSLDADPTVLKPGCGWMPPDWLPTMALRKGLRALGRAPDGLLADYSPARGPTGLRRLLLARLAGEGIEATADQIMLTTSGTQAIDLICRLLLQPGDAVVVDDPCYFNFHALLRAHQVRILGAPFTPTGPDVEAFARIVAGARPRLYITNSALHNPTGATLSPRTAHRVLAEAVAHGVTVVEDDIFADFEPEPSPRLASLDGLAQVIRIGSFSKTLSASVRCGYIAARADWIERLADLQIATHFGGPGPVAAELVAHVLAGGGYRKHMDAVRQRLARARKDVIARLAPLGLTPWVIPRGGFYLWCRLPDGLDSTAVARDCMRENVMLAPGNVFSASQSAGAFLRLNVTQMGDMRVYEAMARAIATWKGGAP